MLLQNKFFLTSNFLDFEFKSALRKNKTRFKYYTTSPQLTKGQFPSTLGFEMKLMKQQGVELLKKVEAKLNCTMSLL